jgi:hypothetical protein
MNAGSKRAELHADVDCFRVADDPPSPHPELLERSSSRQFAGGEFLMVNGRASTDNERICVCPWS